MFAFALTLLVVALDVPKNYTELMHLVGGFLPFAACFALLVWMWYEHNLFFRRFELQDTFVVVANSALLFVVLFYVYPLRFMFDSFAAQVIPALRPALGVAPMQLHELANASAVYGLGFCVLFLIYASLYWHAYRKAGALGLGPLETFDARMYATHHLISAGVGALALAVALLAPLRIVFISPMMFILMAPAHGLYGWRAGRERARSRPGWPGRLSRLLRTWERGRVPLAGPAFAR
ncbi:hypothetical protein BH23ACI1_BH23ACI1_02540 [soil metagenome]